MYSQNAFKQYSDAVMARHYRRYTTQHSFTPVNVSASNLPSDDINADTDLHQDFSKLVHNRTQEDSDPPFKKMTQEEWNNASSKIGCSVLPKTGETTTSTLPKRDIKTCQTSPNISPTTMTPFQPHGLYPGAMHWGWGPSYSFPSGYGLYF